MTETTASHGGRRALALSLPTWALLSGLLVVSALLRVLLARGSTAPWIIPDELVYTELARSFSESGRFTVREAPFSALSFGPAYPILMSAVYLLAESTSDAYFAVKAANCFLFSTAALPAYLLARRLLDRSSALAVAALTLLVPSAIYTTKVMTESLSYPLFLVAVLALVRVLERPTAARQAIVLAAVALAVLARAQMAALVPAFLTATVLVALVEARERGRLDRASFVRSLAQFRLTWAFAGISAAAAVALAVVSRSSAGAFIGPRELLLADLEVAALARSFVYHAGGLDLYLGVIPFAAFLLVAGSVLAGRERERGVRIVTIASVAIVFWLLVVAAAYLSSLASNELQPTVRVYDRYVFYAAPLVLTAFVWWLRRGLPRPRGWAAVAALAAAALPALLPFAELIRAGREWGVSSSSVALVPWVLVEELVGDGIALSLVVAALSGGLALVFLRTRAGRSTLLTLTAANFVLVGLAAYALNDTVASEVTRLGVGAEADWIDRRVGRTADVVAVWSGTERRGWRAWYTIWENDLFNESVGRVYHLRDPLPYDPPGTGLTQKGAALLTADGAPLRAEYVLVDAGLPIAGRKLATDAGTRMVLYRTVGDVRLRGTAKFR